MGQTTQDVQKPDAGIAAAVQRVDELTAGPPFPAQWADGAARFGKLIDAWLKDVEKWKKQCHRKVLSILRRGLLEEPIPRGKRDTRTIYIIRGLIPCDLAEEFPSDPATASPDLKRRMAAALVGVLENPDLNSRLPHGNAGQTDAEWKAWKRYQDDGTHRAVTMRIWCRVPDKPVPPGVSPGARFAAMSADDQRAVAVARLLKTLLTIRPDALIPEDVRDDVAWALEITSEEEAGRLLRVVDSRTEIQISVEMPSRVFPWRDKALSVHERVLIYSQRHDQTKRPTARRLAAEIGASPGAVAKADSWKVWGKAILSSPERHCKRIAPSARQSDRIASDRKAHEEKRIRASSKRSTNNPR